MYHRSIELIKNFLFHTAGWHDKGDWRFLDCTVLNSKYSAITLPIYKKKTLSVDIMKLIIKYNLHPLYHALL